MKKKFRSKWFRVAVEGATTDGRQIERQWLVDAAETYNPNTYGARVWVEHYRSVLPDSPFRAYGDVLAAKTEEVDVNGVKKLALFVQIEPTDDLIAMNKARQKLYTSIEISPKFADTGRAYLDGLAVTDSPASLGTEMLTFSAQNPDASPLKARKSKPDNLFSELVEAQLEFDEIVETPSVIDGLFSRVSDLLGRSKAKASKDEAQFSELNEAVEALAGHAADQAKVVASADEALKSLTGKHEKLTTDFADLIKRLGETQDHSQTTRPAMPGGDGAVLTAY
ncbi:GPO family capsid scaffolding protein [Pseudomonas arsenicoxydans]|uniref:Phage capsid protein n=1 Tax=Pseudomonas arsenicoxydans TaxID=702115 RepID=A0A502HRR6_9PSED|nr:GPO family capsid scaffolding protein [Pseudomonas arsenicoxydans]TPG77351.1 phage capsid protein [Pseudomonas arsenicoxydans]